jgi:hypothetical protein
MTTLHLKEIVNGNFFEQGQTPKKEILFGLKKSEIRKSDISDL